MKPEPIALLASLHPCGCVVQQPKAGNCSITVPNQSTCCICCDTCSSFSSSNNKKPDFILLHFPRASSLIWIVLEMKSRPQHPRDIALQLQAGADAIETDPKFQISAQEGPKPIVGLIPMLVHNGKMHESDLQILQTRKVKFGNKKLSILSKKGGVDISKLPDCHT